MNIGKSTFAKKEFKIRILSSLLICVLCTAFLSACNSGSKGDLADVQSASGPVGTEGADGISIIWLGSADSEPVSCDAANINKAYHNTTDGISYICNGSEWGIFAQDGADGKDGIDTTAPLAADSAITVTNRTANSISLSWVGATDDNSNKFDLEYMVLYSTTDNINSAEDIINNGTVAILYTNGITSGTISGLSADLTYYFNVLVKDDSGNETPYAAGSASTDVTAPVAGGGSGAEITLSNITASSVDLSWNTATDNVTAANLLQYQVVQSGSNNISTVADAQANGTVIQDWTGDIGSLNVTGLALDTRYYFNVLVRDSVDNISIYTVVEFISDFILPVAGGGSGATITAINPSTNGAALSWNKSTDTFSAQADLVYAVYYSISTLMDTVAEIKANGILFGIFTDLGGVDLLDLYPGTTYYINIIVSDEAGNESPYTRATAATSGVTQMGGSLQGGIGLYLTAEVTTPIGTAGSSGSTDGTGSAARFDFPDGITTDGTNLYVADTSNHTIRQIVISSGVVTTLAGSAGSSGSTDATGSAARFYLPQGITTDGTNLYVCDSLNRTIRQIVISSGVVTTLAGTAESSGSTDATGSAARFDLPRGITTDGTNLYVSDSTNDTIRQIVISSAVVTTLAGTAGSPGSADGTGTAALFEWPNGITTDGTNLYVCDSLNRTIRQIVISSAVVTTLAGSAGSSGSTDATGSAARFYLPQGITTDGTNLYVSDRSNHTIRKIR